MPALVGNSIIIIWRLCQQTRKHLCRRGGEGGYMSQRTPAYCVLVLFISHMEKGTFWTGSDLTHSHTVLMQSGPQLLSGVHKKSCDWSYMRHKNRHIKMAACDVNKKLFLIQYLKLKISHINSITPSTRYVGIYMLAFFPPVFCKQLGK